MKILFVWISTCILVFIFLDTAATSPVQVRVEDYREIGMTDEQVVGQAIQQAYASEHNQWWINNKHSYLVFDAHRNYQIDPSLLESFEVEMNRNEERRMFRILHPALLISPSS